MDLKTAKQVLTEMGTVDITATNLRVGRSIYGYIDFNTAETHIHIDGKVTPDQLEAIATWMRDPSGVVNA